LRADETLGLAKDVLAGLTEKTNIRFHADSANVALDTAAQYLGDSGLPGSALLMLKLAAIRAADGGEEIGAAQILETLSQLSGLPVSILDTKEQLDLKSVRAFFAARVIGQEEAVAAVVWRIAMLKAASTIPTSRSAFSCLPDRPAPARPNSPRRPASFCSVRSSA
jgi:ATP-dependent Clp protease ATP-binding subunit ClpC